MTQVQDEDVSVEDRRQAGGSGWRRSCARPGHYLRAWGGVQRWWHHRRGGGTVPRPQPKDAHTPALTTYLMLQALLAHLYAHPHLLPPTAIYPASQHWPTGPSIASLSHSSTRASLQSPGSQLITPLLTHYVKPACRWEEPQHSGAGLLNSPRS